MRRAGETVTSSESGRHLATQMSLLAAMIDIGAVTTASLMAPVVVDPVRCLLHPSDRDALRFPRFDGQGVRQDGSDSGSAR